MKRSTCKLLLWIGIVLIIFAYLGGIFAVLTTHDLRQGNIIAIILLSLLLGLLYALIIPGSWAGIILIIIAKVKWNSEEENKDLIKAQINALKRGKVNIELKGKMRKLK